SQAFGKMFPCGECDRAFFEDASRSHHRILAHPEMYPSSDGGRCYFCGAEVSSYFSLHDHIKENHHLEFTVLEELANSVSKTARSRKSALFLMQVAWLKSTEEWSGPPDSKCMNALLKKMEELANTPALNYTTSQTMPNQAPMEPLEALIQQELGVARSSNTRMLKAPYPPDPTSSQSCNSSPPSGVKRVRFSSFTNHVQTLVDVLREAQQDRSALFDGEPSAKIMSQREGYSILEADGVEDIKSGAGVSHSTEVVQPIRRELTNNARLATLITALLGMDCVWDGDDAYQLERELTEHMRTLPWALPDDNPKLRAALYLAKAGLRKALETPLRPLEGLVSYTEGFKAMQVTLSLWRFMPLCFRGRSSLETIDRLNETVELLLMQFGELHRHLVQLQQQLQQHSGQDEREAMEMVMETYEEIRARRSQAASSVHCSEQSIKLIDSSNVDARNDDRMQITRTSLQSL
ncbi:hypothetical protein PENTCL1PPCAC_1449, partial [Pristionchus entomophagus]